MGESAKNLVELLWLQAKRETCQDKSIDVRETEQVQLGAVDTVHTILWVGQVWTRKLDLIEQVHTTIRLYAFKIWAVK